MLQEPVLVCSEIRERERKVAETGTPKISTEQLAPEKTLEVHTGFGAGQGLRDKSIPDPGKPQEQKPRNETVLCSTDGELPKDRYWVTQGVAMSLQEASGVIREVRSGWSRWHKKE